MGKKHYLGVDETWEFVKNCMGMSAVDDRLIFFDVEVFPNLFVICWKFEGGDNEYEVLYPEVCRKHAHDETWEFVKNCMGMSAVDLLKCFGLCSVKAVLEKLTYEEAKDLYDAWVKKNTVKEMTVEEISEALGYDVKIVGKKE